jgi:hypothetical protein
LYAAAAPAEAEVRIERDGVDASRHSIVISGEIDVATLMDFSQAIDDARITGAAAKVVELESPGGSLSAAMAIGVLIREGRFDTSVAPRGKCYSACVLILAAGVHRTVTSGKVGVHRPYYDKGLYTPGSSPRVEADYGQVTDGIHQYLASMGVRDGLMDAMMKVPSKFMRHLTSREVAVYGLDNSAPCEIVQVASLESDEALPAEASARELKPQRKASKAAVRKKNAHVASRRPVRSVRTVRQVQRLAGPWGRVAALPSAPALRRGSRTGRY